MVEEIEEEEKDQLFIKTYKNFASPKNQDRVVVILMNASQARKKQQISTSLSTSSFFCLYNQISSIFFSALSSVDEEVVEQQQKLTKSYSFQEKSRIIPFVLGWPRRGSATSEITPKTTSKYDREKRAFVLNGLIVSLPSPSPPRYMQLPTLSNRLAIRTFLSGLLLIAFFGQRLSGQYVSITLRFPLIKNQTVESLSENFQTSHC